MLQGRSALFSKGPVLPMMVCHRRFVHIFVAVITLHTVAATSLTTTSLRGSSSGSCFTTPCRRLCCVVCTSRFIAVSGAVEVPVACKTFN